jgi:hypothetical protein
MFKARQEVTLKKIERGISKLLPQPELGQILVAGYELKWERISRISRTVTERWRTMISGNEQSYFWTSGLPSFLVQIL